MAHEFNFKEVFSKELKREIIERRAKKYVEKFGTPVKDAKIRYENVIKFVSHDRKEVENYIEKDIKNEGLLDIELITSDSEYFVCY